MSCVYFLAHLGLGDHLFTVGAIRFLMKFYDRIYIPCYSHYYENVKLFFENEKNITLIPFLGLSNQLNDEIKNLLRDKYQNNDVIVLGHHKQHLPCKITNKHILENVKDDSTYDLKITGFDYANINGFIKEWYDDLNLGLKIFYENFDLNKTETSQVLYNSIKQYENIIFIQNRCSTGEVLSINNLIKKYKNDANSILISTSENLYEDNKELYDKKYQICNSFVNNYLVHYLDTILNSSEIYILDSCFTGIVLPLYKTNKLKAKIVNIIFRGNINNEMYKF